MTTSDAESITGPIAARLSKLMFEARELIDMYGDVVESRTGQRSEWTRRVRDDIDAFRAEQGWSPHGFGGEDTIRITGND